VSRREGMPYVLDDPLEWAEDQSFSCPGKWITISAGRQETPCAT